jgi:hypothetical protein
MDPKKMRKTIDNLLAELERNPRIARRPTFMARYGRPLGFGLALGIGGVAGCSDSSSDMSKKDALSAGVDAYGATIADLAPPDTRDALPPAPDVYGVPDLPPLIDTADALPIDGVVVDVQPRDAADVLPLIGDAYGVAGDARDTLPPPGDLYGVFQPETKDVLPPAVDIYAADRPPVDTRDASPTVDGGTVDSDQVG